MPRLHFPHVVWTLLVIAVIGTGVLPIAYGLHPRIRPLLMDILHIPAGFIVGFALYLALPAEKRFRVFYAGFVAALLFGALELVQPFVQRTATWQDFFRSMVGVFAGIASVWLGQWKKRYALSFAVLSLSAALLFAGAPLARGLHAWWRADQAFPNLGDFEGTLFLFLWRPISRETLVILDHPSPSSLAAGDRPGPNLRYLKVRPTGPDWSGVLLQPTQTDWTDYGSLCFNARSDAPGVALAVVFDAGIDAFPSPDNSSSLVLSNGWGHYCVHLPELRGAPKPFPSHQVRRIFFAVRQAQPIQPFYLDEIRLVRP